MASIRSWDKSKINSVISRVAVLFLLMQPIFDILSFLYVRGYIPVGISTYLKPLIIGLINIVLILVYKKQMLRCGITYVFYLLLTVVHTLLLHGILADTAEILHEIRFMINIFYFLLCYHDFRILYENAENKDYFTGKLKKTVIATFALYCVLFLLAVVTGTSGRTYEYSDAYKTGFKGWMDSGQIFAHTLCICLPLILSVLLNNKIKNTALRLLCKLSVVLPIAVLYMIGTKVAYYIPLLVLAAQLALELFFALKEKKAAHCFNALLCAALIVACIAVYPITPVKNNIDINNSVLSVIPNEKDIEAIMKNEKKKLKIGKDDKSDSEHSGQGGKVTESAKNDEWTEQALYVIEQKYVDGELHPSDMRNRQLVFNFEKFKRADLKYKLFGIGYIINGDMAIERDVLCVLFSFGIVGFILVLLRPLLLWFKSAFAIIRHPLKTDIHTLCLFEGFSMFFFISWYAGYTFIYTTFAVFLAVIMTLLTHGVSKLNAEHSEIEEGV